MVKLTPIQSIMAARRAVRSSAPYFSTALYRVQFREVPAERCASKTNPGGFPTLGMTDNAICYYSGAFVAGLTAAELAGALLHELMHFLRQDVARFATRTAIAPPEDRAALNQLTNLATDMANNDDIVAAGWKLPGRPLTKAEYDSAAEVDGIFWVPSSIGAPEGRTAQEYLELLLKKNPPPSQRKGKGKPVAGKPGQGAGQCGSCAGHAHEVEAEMGLGKGVPDGKDGKGSGGEKGDGAGEGLTAQEADRVRAQVAREIAQQVQQQKGRGNIPAGLARWAQEQLAPPKIPWQQKLQRAVRRSVQRASGAIDMTFNRISRRQAGLGFGAGTPRLPALHGCLPSVAVVIDTSGSMGGNQLKTAISETSGVIRATGGAVQFCAIDCGTEGLSKVRTWQEAAAKLKGGGGTDMKPAFKLLMEQGKPPSVIIVITDGMIGDPGPAPVGAHVIWVLVGSTYTNDVKAFGEVIIVEED